MRETAIYSHPDNVVVARRGEHARLGHVPRDRVDAAGAMARELLEQLAAVLVPYRDFRVCVTTSASILPRSPHSCARRREPTFAAADNEALAGAAEATAYDKVALLLALVLLSREAVVQADCPDLVAAEIDQHLLRVVADVETGDFVV